MATEVVYFFTPFVLLFIPEHCHDQFFVHFNFFDVPCLKIGISKALGYAIILGSVMVKVPQIIKLVQAKSGVGLSLAALLAEMVSITFTMAYSVQNQFPFSAWGECVFMSTQDLMLAFLILYYGESYAAAFTFVPIYVGINYLLCSHLTPLLLVTKLQQSTLVILVISRFLQIWENYSNGHTGQLSFITSLLLAAGSLARVFTTLQETGDALMMAQFILACSMNCLILGQIFWYWNISELKKKVE